ncbi:hypothetical protein [Hyalangium sp.]|uniref:hypothetical protein n=1 Tax=Hyalangium sp. TaxID=2028555 RepID=UPI002D2B21CD|nr:hypothetical protein [Hyalangium sp.]HYH99658.1 hypothetical protein [Hyalangium sp.]
MDDNALLDQLRRYVRNEPLDPLCDWTVLLDALEVARDRANAPGVLSELELLLEFLDQRRPIPQKEDTLVPHAMPPEEMLMYDAIKAVIAHPALGQEHETRFQESLQRILDEASSPALSHLARKHLKKA